MSYVDKAGTLLSYLIPKLKKKKNQFKQNYKQIITKFTTLLTSIKKDYEFFCGWI